MREIGLEAARSAEDLGRGVMGHGTATDRRDGVGASAGRAAAGDPGAGLWARVSARAGADVVSRHVSGPGAIVWRDGGYAIETRSAFAARLAERKVGRVFRDAAEGAEIRFVVRAEGDEGDGAVGGGTPGRGADSRRDAERVRAQEHRPAPARRGFGHRRGSTGGAGFVSDGRHRFERFIVGEANRLAYGAALRLADGDLAFASAPLFIHGDCGLGKTHLLRAIATRFSERFPGRRVRCVTAEEFTNAYIEAVKTGTVPAFQKMYRRVDLLCIDDVHCLATKKGTQVELLHTLDALELTGARIALASDSHPRAIKPLSDALISRFSAGAVVRLDAPDDLIRRALIGELASRHGARLSEGAAAVLDACCLRSAGSRSTGTVSVRDLEGAIKQVVALSRLSPELVDAGGLIGSAAVERALDQRAGGAGVRNDGPIRVESIARVVCEALSVEFSELAGPGRHARVVLARGLVAVIAKNLTARSYPEITHAIGKRSHSTMITAAKRLRERIEADERLSIGGAHDGMPLGAFAAMVERRVRAGA